MRLWHKDLLSVLPQKQLVAQWRECCCIISNIAKNGTPNHILVNYVLDYSLDEFRRYAQLVINEMKHRGYKISIKSIKNFRKNAEVSESCFSIKRTSELYEGIHNERYLIQCFHNLEEKYDRGMFSKEEYDKLLEYMQVERFIKN